MSNFKFTGSLRYYLATKDFKWYCGDSEDEVEILAEKALKEFRSDFLDYLIKEVITDHKSNTLLRQLKKEIKNE